MIVSDAIGPPEFVESGATDATGLDLLGLRLPAQVIGNSLLNGITTITPTVRYLSLRTWLLYRYIHAKPAPPNDWGHFKEYARHAEAAFAMANLRRSDSTLGLIGAIEGAKRLHGDCDPLPTNKVTENPAVNIYAGPSDQLRLTRARGKEIPEIDSEHGEHLALAVEESFEKTALGRQLRKAEPLGSVSRKALEEFVTVAWVSDIPDRERQELIRTIIPADPTPGDRSRIATYAVLLSVAERSADPVQERHLFEEAVRPDRVTPAVLAENLDGWLLYAVRDSVAVAGEAALAIVVQKLGELDPDGIGVRDELVVRRLLEDSVSEQVAALRELHLASTTEDLGSLRVRELSDRVRESTPRAACDHGVLRWSSHLVEPTIYMGVGGVRAGALMFGLISWILADRRAGEAVRNETDAVQLLSYQGRARFGLQQVILPRLKEWTDRDLSVEAALNEFTHLVIDQHLRISWARLAQQPGKDGSVLRRDGSRLIKHADYVGSRTDSRLSQAISWLHQLGLLGEDGPTNEGVSVLERTLEALAA